MSERQGIGKRGSNFFLRGVGSVADEATATAKAILKLKEDCAARLQSADHFTGGCLRLLEALFEKPYVQRKNVIDILAVSNPTAGHILETFCKAGVLRDLDPQKNRSKLYCFSEYINILNRGTELEMEDKDTV